MRTLLVSFSLTAVLAVALAPCSADAAWVLWYKQGGSQHDPRSLHARVFRSKWSEARVEMICNHLRRGADSMKLQTALLLITVLLGSVDSANAACAWVLWERSSFAEGNKTWTEWKSDGFPSHDHCRAAIHRTTEALKGRPGWKVEGSLIQSTGGGIVRITELSCLPDTIDPRAPKGSGR
jgi:hypothetical protein